MAEQNEPNWGHFLGLGMQIAVGVGLGVIVGLWIDRKLGWSPFGVVICSMLGLGGGMYLLIKETIGSNKD